MADISLSNINKYFGRMHAVKNVNLTIKNGSFHTLLGPSGCGKTSTLRMIAGLELPSSGAISIGSQTVYSHDDGLLVPPAKRDIGLIFQDYALWPHMTVGENVEFGLEVQGVKGAEKQNRLDTILKRVQLDGLEGRHPSELSGGQQQRVAMARMLVVEPQVLLMDEPLSNLDAKLRLNMRSELTLLHREIGATTIYVTHDQREALSMSDQITVMCEGEVQQNTSPAELYDRPANLFVAGFVGAPAMNLLDGTIVETTETEIAIKLDAIPIKPIAINRVEKAETGRKVVLGIRPEDIVMHSEGHAPHAISGIVRNVLPTGPEIIVEISLSRLSLTAQTQRNAPVRPDEPINISFAESHIHLFDQRTGRRLN
jgi:multiple sugar transport system ATP-binding protein